MRSPNRRRPLPRKLVAPPDGADVEAAASLAKYVGSAEHKSFPSFAGAPRLRADATKCPPELADAGELSEWIGRAIRSHQTGALWEGGFPRYAWLNVNGVVYEARQLGPGSGQYKGYPLDAGEVPIGLAK